MESEEGDNRAEVDGVASRAEETAIPDKPCSMIESCVGAAEGEHLTAPGHRLRQRTVHGRHAVPSIASVRAENRSISTKFVLSAR